MIEIGMDSATIAVGGGQSGMRAVMLSDGAIRYGDLLLAIICRSENARPARGQQVQLQHRGRIDPAHSRPMRDIVATIQPEQDELVRARPADPHFAQS